MTHILEVDTPDVAGAWVAERMLAHIAHTPDTVLGLATGSTPLPVYRALVAGAKQRGTDLSRVRGFASGIRNNTGPSSRTRWCVRWV